MSEKVLCHISLHYVLPYVERDVWRSQDAETKDSWQSMTGQQDPEGDPTEYVALIPLDEISRFNRARNCRYAVPAVEAHAHGDPQKARTKVLGGVPGANTLIYHFAEEAESHPDGGEGVVYFHLDTGATNNPAMETSRLLGHENFTDRGNVADVSDRNGHGSMTLSLLLPKKAQVYVFKVLGDDGSGSSAGIVRAIRECANIASRDSSRKYILSGSLGGPPGQTFQPYTDACALAESFGVLCRWSAGNDGQGRISAPANWREDRASIAYNLQRDHIASFSNYGISAGIASHGEEILVYDKNGSLAEVDGTSFSLPLWNRFTGIVSSLRRDRSIFDVNAAELSTGRDTPSPVQQEPHGVLNVLSATQKLAPPPVLPAPEPKPKPEPYPDPPQEPEIPIISLTQLENTHPEALKKVHARILHRKSGDLGTFKGSEVE